MPVFIDSHHGAELPLGVIRGFLRAARGGITDDFGVTPIDLFCGDDGRVFCVFVAPDEAAIRQRHAAYGVICRRVRRVPAVGGVGQDWSVQEKAVVRQMIAQEHAWPGESQGSGSSSGEWLRQVG